MTPTTQIPESCIFSETRTIQGKTMEIYFSVNEQDARTFAHRMNGLAYKFLPDSYRIIIPVTQVGKEEQ